MAHLLDNQPPPRKNNITTIVIVSVLAGLVVIVGGFLAVMGFMSSSPEAGRGSGDSSDDSSLTATPPTIESFTAESVTGDDFIFNVITSEYDTKKYFIEYELTNQNRVEIATGTETSHMFNLTIKPNNATSYRLKVRLTDKTNSGDWSQSSVLEISKAEGMKVLDPAPAYNDTAWANGEGGLENFTAAMKAAYNITEPDPTTMYCMELNSGRMEPGLLLPPMPATYPRSLFLAYTVTGVSGDGGVDFSYLWCNQ